MHCYLDDFVGVEPTFEKATQAYAAILALADDLGLALSHHKCVPPPTPLSGWGYNIDTVSMSIKIPKEKLDDILRNRSHQGLQSRRPHLSTSRPSSASHSSIL